MAIATTTVSIRSPARIAYKLTDDITLTSLTAYDKLTVKAGIAAQGTTLQDESFYQVGRIEAMTQDCVWQASSASCAILGANFRVGISDSYTAMFEDSTATISLGLPLKSYYLDTHNRDRNYAGFANLEYDLTSRLNLQGGIRYTSNTRNFDGCLADSGDGYYAAIQNSGRSR
jgi:hypothetical protein